MVSYFSAGTSVGVKSGNPDDINADDLCGKAVGVQAGTVQVDDITARNQKCTTEGKPAIQVTELQAQTDVTLALTANRIVAMLADSPVVDYAVKTTERAARGRRRRPTTPRRTASRSTRARPTSRRPSRAPCSR